VKDYQLVKAINSIAIERLYPVIKELRPDLNFPDFMRHYQAARAADGYELVMLVDGENKILAVMGYRVLHDFVHGRHLYIDDLVITESERSRGWGSKLLSHAEVIARELGCANLRLCTGVENDRGKTFYERNGWKLRAVAYKKQVAG